MNRKSIPLTIGRTWHTIRSRPLLWDTVTTTLFSTVGKSVGFLIPFFIAAWFGVSSETDAFFFAYGLILFLSGMFAQVVESVIVPYIAEARANNEDIGKFVGNILGVTGIGLLAFAGAVLLVIKPVLSVITRFDPQALDLIYWLLFETTPLIILLVWTSVLAGTLNAYKKFAFPAISPAFRAIVNLSIIFSFKSIFGIHAIALGYVAGEVVRLIILAGVIKRLNLFKLGLSFQVDPKLREFLKTASYQTMGMVAVGLNPIVDKTMASWLGKGSVSVLHYADRLYMIPITFMTTGLMVTLLSHWSNMYYNGQQRLKKAVKKTIKIVGFITLPVMLFLILFHQPIVKFAFGRGAFNQARLQEVGWVWVYYLFGLAPYIFSQIFNRRLLVLKRTRLLCILSLFWVSLNVILNILFMYFLQVAGIALSTSIVYVIASIILFGIFKKDIESNEDKNISN
jgi:putative peptidoglycan lipid II flippase